MTTPSVRDPLTVDRPGLPPLQGPLHIHAQRAMGFQPTTLGGRLPGALLPRSLPPIQQSPPTSPTATAAPDGFPPPLVAISSLKGSQPPPLPPIEDKGKGPISGKPFPKKASPHTSSDENTDGEGNVGRLSTIKSPAPFFPTRRQLPQIGSPLPPPPLHTQVSSKSLLPTMAARKPSVDPFSSTGPSIGSPVLPPIGRSPPAPLNFQRPRGLGLSPSAGALPLRPPLSPPLRAPLSPPLRPPLSPPLSSPPLSPPLKPLTLPSIQQTGGATATDAASETTKANSKSDPVKN